MDYGQTQPPNRAITPEAMLKSCSKITLPNTRKGTRSRCNLIKKEGPAHRRPFVTFGVLLTF